MATEAGSSTDRLLAERGLVRLTFDVPLEDGNRFVHTADSSGYNKVTTFMRAVRLLADLDAHVRAGGAVVLQHKDGRREQLHLR